MHYDMQINESGKIRYVDGNGYCPGDALNNMVKLAHIREGATVKLVGTDHIEWMCNKPY